MVSKNLEASIIDKIRTEFRNELIWIETNIFSNGDCNIDLVDTSEANRIKILI